MGNQKVCRFCEHSNPKRINDAGELRCVKNHKFVAAASVCGDYADRIDGLKSMVRPEFEALFNEKA